MKTEYVDTGDFYEKLSRNSKFCPNGTKIIGLFT